MHLKVVICIYCILYRIYAIKNFKIQKYVVGTCQKIAKYSIICKIKLCISYLLTIIKTCSLSSYFLEYLEKTCKYI